mgnify:CR=1 FL=1
MKKENIIAIILGFVFGLIFAIFILFGLSQIQLKKEKILVSEKKTITISPIKKNNLDLLIIDSPKNNIIVNYSQINIKGSASKDSLIVVQSPIKDLAFQNKDKKFKFDFPLVLGENVIKIVAYPKVSNIKIQEKTLFIYYLPDEI